MRAVAIIALFALSGCSGPASDDARNEIIAHTRLPTGPFKLACAAGTGETPAFARKNFQISIDPAKGTYALPGWDDMPIARIEPSSVVLRDETIPLGRDNNPETWHVSYDQRSRTFSYEERASSIVPINYQFTSTCEVQS